MSKRDHGDGGIDPRGPDRWRLRWRVDGKRFTKSFRGSITEARRQLRRLIKNADDGQHVAPVRTLIANYLRDWLDADTGLSPKTRERYRQRNHPAKAVMDGDQAAAAGVWQCFQCQGSSSCSWDTG